MHATINNCLINHQSVLIITKSDLPSVQIVTKMFEQLAKWLNDYKNLKLNCYLKNGNKAKRGSLEQMFRQKII